MKRSQFILMTQLKEKLQEFPHIVTSLDKKDPYFIDKIMNWLKSSENILSTYNISEVSEIAGFRSRIISARLTDGRGINIRKNQTKAAAGILYDIQDTVLNVLLPYERKMNDCREIVKQLLALAAPTFTPKYSTDMNFDDFIRNIWLYLLSHNELKVGAIRLKSMLSEIDILMLMGDEIELSDFA
ncbi:MULTISPECIES: hypothetical protein [Chryseobacterium]|uniref:Uncharacterized protein n=1 Tax=Chryseobacterium camelliae TaxID=1265445 RepID=A0ABU0TN04_9FLAO|nr:MULTISPECIES: hypothetical protein [Chryseobacterium]MDT3407735.1 hypothetical protein [Pseudacidovorax intermedius]MDQ1098414.1 hypothetical protein [Chryseobacterium camelliae]MDQ1102338.1 hypothetical protein [Chryseobacterium sp. SORGH_AS_1048]MDR6085774.1 hypothetical protein [Chryseobacterium sp. SORGH_AS_0909]MDR6130139.1 hypothetical protein [Chryseobacterium sp. SORGH_AS_1175]